MAAVMEKTETSVAAAVQTVDPLDNVIQFRREADRKATSEAKIAELAAWLEEPEAEESDELILKSESIPRLQTHRPVTSLWLVLACVAGLLSSVVVPTVAIFTATGTVPLIPTPAGVVNMGAVPAPPVGAVSGMPASGLSTGAGTSSAVGSSAAPGASASSGVAPGPNAAPNAAPAPSPAPQAAPNPAPQPSPGGGGGGGAALPPNGGGGSGGGSAGGNPPPQQPPPTHASNPPAKPPAKSDGGSAGHTDAKGSSDSKSCPTGYHLVSGGSCASNGGAVDLD